MAKHKGSRSKGPPSFKRPPLTHFLCIPLVTATSKPVLQRSLAQFRGETTSSNPKIDREIEAAAEEKGDVTLSTVSAKAIRPVGSLHCTLGVMSLDEDRLAEAVECLHGRDVRELIRDMCTRSSGAVTSQELKAPLQDHGSSEPIVVDLKGLTSMHSPRQTSILYCAPVDASGRLYPFCLGIQKIFKEKGFLIDDDRPLKLHATIVNTIYAKGSRSADHGPNARAPLKIDATALLEKYKDFCFANDLVLDRVAICEMGAKKVYIERGEEVDAEYTEVATAALPT